MRLRSLPLLLLPYVLAHCGSRQDLLIGEVARLEAGSAGVAAGGTNATGGAVTTAGSGSGGTDAVAGSDRGGSDTSGSAGAGGDDGDCLPGAEPPPDALLHRYSFDGTGATALDSISGADGEIIGTTLDGSGVVSMSGDSPEYVDLPNGIVSSLAELTIVTWMTWTNGPAYQRVFDFGISSGGEGVGSSGRSYLAVMPMTGFENQARPGLGAEIKAPGFPTVTLASTENMRNRAAQVSLVFKSGAFAALYLDGNLLASRETTIKLSDIDDRNNWVGRSQFEDDPELEGSYEELRIYGSALDSCQLHSLLVRGPEAP